MINQLHIGQTIIDLIWLLFLSLLFFYFWHTRQKLKRMDAWIKTNAHITQCELSLKPYRFWPKIEYLYKVDGNEFMGEDLFYDNAHRSINTPYARKVAYKIVEAYKNNQDIEIFYNPADPKESVHNISIPGKLNSILILLFGLIVLHLVVMGVRVFA